MDLIVVRLLFVALLAGVCFFFRPFGMTEWASAAMGAGAAGAFIVFELRVRALSLKRLIGAVVGSILGILGAALFCLVLRGALAPGPISSLIQIFDLLLMTYVGLLVGAVTADRVAARLGAKLTVAAGFAVVAAGLAVGTTMSAASGDGFIAGWTFVAGAGAGLGFATAASAALVELSADRSGVGSALLQAVIKLGPAFGASILGSVLTSTYQSRVQLAGLPAQAAASVRASVFGGLAVAKHLNSLALLVSVRDAFVAGLDDAVQQARWRRQRDGGGGPDPRPRLPAGTDAGRGDGRVPSRLDRPGERKLDRWGPAAPA